MCINYTCVYVYECMYVSTFVGMYVYICMYVSMYVCGYADIRISIFTYTYRNLNTYI